MSDLLSVSPFTRPAAGSVALPGSKSITNRALLLAALAEGVTRLENALFSEDTRIMVAALQKLGIPVEADEAGKTITVEGKGGAIPVKHAELFVGNAGTAARFLTAFCALASRGTYRLDGVPQMRFRPMQGLIEALESMGARIHSNRGHFPLEIEGKGLRGGEFTIDAGASSQLLSALLMVAPVARDDVTIRLQGETVSRPFINMTLAMMHQFGQPLCNTDSNGAFFIRSNRPYRAPDGGVYPVERDATAASYFLALPLVVGGELLIEDLRFSGLQGDVDFVKVLTEVGSTIEATPAGLLSSAPSPPDSHGRGVSSDFTAISDTFLTLAAIAPLLKGPTRISGIAHTRKQETDRVGAMAYELRKLGQHVIEKEDSLEIHPAPLSRGVEIQTYHDHRVAMSFAVLGSHDLLGDGTPWLKIKDPFCCAKTFPDFFDVLEEVRSGGGGRKQWTSPENSDRINS